MATSVRFVQNGQADEVVVFDASPNQAHNFRADVTDHAVELSENNSDHVRPKPAQVRVEGILTDFPTALSGSKIAGFNVTSGYGRAKADFERLLSLHKNGTLVTLTTSLREYPNVVIEAIDSPRDKSNTRNQVRVSILFKEIKQSTVAAVPITASTTRNGQNKQTGGKQNANASAVEGWQPGAKTSFLYDLAFSPSGEKTPPKAVIPPYLQRPGP